MSDSLSLWERAGVRAAGFTSEPRFIGGTEPSPQPSPRGRGSQTPKEKLPKGPNPLAHCLHLDLYTSLDA
jgi:hypothetical protein